MKPLKFVPFVLFLLFVACSGTDRDNNRASSAADISKPANCSLVTEKEVGEVLGKPVTKGGDSILGCSYIPAGKKVSYFTVLVTEKKGKPEDTFNNFHSGIKILKLEGDGNAGAMAVEDGFIMDAVVFSGKWSVRFNVTFADIELGSKKFSIFKSVMKKALSRL